MRVSDATGEILLLPIVGERCKLKRRRTECRVARLGKNNHVANALRPAGAIIEPMYEDQVQGTGLQIVKLDYLCDARCRRGAHMRDRLRVEVALNHQSTVAVPRNGLRREVPGRCWAAAMHCG